MNIKQFLIAACIGTMAAACSSNDDYNQQSDNTIKLRSKVVVPVVGTKADCNNELLLGDNFASGTSIDVHMYQAGTNTAYSTGSNNLQYSIGTAGSMKIKSGTEPEWTETAVDIIAFYPWSCYPTAQNQTTWDGVYYDQSTDDKYLSSDFMVAQALNKTKSDGPVTLEFKHILTKIIVKIEGVTYSDVTNVQLYAGTDFGIQRNSDNSINVLYDNGEKDILLGDYKSSGVCGIISPQTIPVTQYDHFISFEYQGNTFKYTPNSSIELKGGYAYTFTLAVKDNVVSAKNYTVTGWNDTDPNCAQSGDAVW